MVLGETKKDFLLRSLLSVGATGFEPAAAWSQTRSATGLRYTPNAFLDGNAGAKLQISFGTYKF